MKGLPSKWFFIFKSLIIGIFFLRLTLKYQKIIDWIQNIHWHFFEYQVNQLEHQYLNLILEILRF
ncbi:unnamed protein product [Paramecium sonneborni]|uniref:Uncharacterized protein n=1 Tax=Paramecium sonneborni TaxID=65129 RepID=A0A8S1RBV7_9CILI|nr:unnamed protein product [Paramecium sonneborni]